VPYVFFREVTQPGFSSIYRSDLALSNKELPTPVLQIWQKVSSWTEARDLTNSSRKVFPGVNSSVDGLTPLIDIP
jgi:hypothetical protein